MTNENNSDQGGISWFPYVLVVTAILVIGVVVLSTNNVPKPENKQQENKSEQANNNKSVQNANTSNAKVKFLTQGGKEEAVTLPFQKDMPKDARMLFTFDLNYKKDGSTKYNFIGDDCVEGVKINGKEVKVERNAEGRCNWQAGIVVDLKDYLKDGVNKAEVETLNGGGMSGLTVRVK